MKDEMITFRLSADLCARLDAVAGDGGRSRYVRGVLEAALRSVRVPGAVEAVPEVDRGSGPDGDARALLEALTGRGAVLRSVAQGETGWGRGRYLSAEEELAMSGYVLVNHQTVEAL